MTPPVLKSMAYRAPYVEDYPFDDWENRTIFTPEAYAAAIVAHRLAMRPPEVKLRDELRPKLAEYLPVEYLFYSLRVKGAAVRAATKLATTARLYKNGSIDDDKRKDQVEIAERWKREPRDEHRAAQEFVAKARIAIGRNLDELDLDELKAIDRELEERMDKVTLASQQRSQYRTAHESATNYRPTHY